ncbi:MAG: hypothetical protein WEA10_05140 [Actinomycetota bacterium]
MTAGALSPSRTPAVTAALSEGMENTTMKVRGDMAVRGAALFLGLSIAFSAVVAWRVPPGEGILGTDVIVAAMPTGELAVDPSGPFLSAAALQPGPESGAPREDLAITNITALTQVVQFRAVPAGKDLQELLWIRIDAGATQIFRGTLGELAQTSDRGVTIGSGKTRILEVRTWLPPDIDEGFRGRIDQINLELVPQEAGS